MRFKGSLGCSGSLDERLSFAEDFQSHGTLENRRSALWSDYDSILSHRCLDRSLQLKVKVL